MLLAVLLSSEFGSLPLSCIGDSSHMPTLCFVSSGVLPAVDFFEVLQPAKVAAEGSWYLANTRADTRRRFLSLQKQYAPGGGSSFLVRDTCWEKVLYMSTEREKKAL